MIIKIKLKINKALNINYQGIYFMNITIKFNLRYKIRSYVQWQKIKTCFY